MRAQRVFTIWFLITIVIFYVFCVGINIATGTSAFGFTFEIVFIGIICGVSIGCCAIGIQKLLKALDL